MAMRIHWNRFEGKRLPENTIKVDRSTRYGNPFIVDDYGREEALNLYRVYIDFVTRWKLLDLSPLKGKDLACSCNLNESCHADILIEILKPVSHEPESPNLFSQTITSES